MIEGRVGCDRCGDSMPLEAAQYSYNGIRYHDGSKFAEYTLRVVHPNGAASFKNLLICKKCQDGLATTLDKARDEFFKAIPNG